MVLPDCCVGLTNSVDISYCNAFVKQEPSELYNTLNTIGIERQELYPTFQKCLKTRLLDADKPLVDLINNYKNNKIDANTASEMNKNTMSLYQTDLYYTIGKFLIFSIILLAYFYFLNGASVVESIKAGVQSVNDKVATLTK
jgi:hypothetical protein